MTKKRANLDTPWKDVLNSYFPEFIAFFFSTIYNDIDWTKKHEFLDKELQQIARDSELGRRLVDKLVKVWRKDGKEAWVLIHVEVQGQRDASFAKRMFVYHCRIFEHYNKPVVSLGILTDKNPYWKPVHYEHRLWGCNVDFEFPVVKLLDYKEQWQILEESLNPFATVVMAHLKSIETRDNPEERKTWKFALIKRLYERGYQQKDIIELFRFIDWIMQLPKELEDSFWREFHKFEEERKMPYITSVERIGMEKGIKQGIEKGIEKGKKQGKEQGLREGLLVGIKLFLDFRFGSEGLELLPEISEIEDLKILKKVQNSLKSVKNIEKLRQIYK
ncbi:MAG: hypothetical protein QG641_2287 [Candidatus Poribacteria bacterium]|nr:hypothetical protein [Candidatus Poribacteria bacterium]